MPNKALRFLIADGEHLQRVKIEKMLNQLGYHRIAPLSGFDEVQALTRSNGVMFGSSTPHWCARARSTC
ncbi:hypothetical protein [Pseudomonas salmasensis]|uniref:hypothetical protein n=1 Tax=Pseudomonas salmasensis TaxID=2745514 RepID=UPI003D2B5CDC